MLLPAGRSYRLVVDTACGLLGRRQQDSLHERARWQPGDLYDELCRSLADQPHQNSTGDNQPAWSPDGTRIAFIINREGSSDVFVIKADGTGVKRLVPFLAGETDPAWSPSGKKIAFVSNSGGDPEIWVMNQDGSNKTQLTNNPATDSSLDWPRTARR